MKRLQLRLLTIMILVALAAGLLGWGASERRKRMALVMAELERAEARVAWAERMEKGHYGSKSMVAELRSDREILRSKLTGSELPSTKP